MDACHIDAIAHSPRVNEECTSELGGKGAIRVLFYLVSLHLVIIRESKLLHGRVFSGSKYTRGGLSTHLKGIALHTPGETKTQKTAPLRTTRGILRRVRDCVQDSAAYPYQPHFIIKVIYLP